MNFDESLRAAHHAAAEAKYRVSKLYDEFEYELDFDQKCDLDTIVSLLNDVLWEFKNTRKC
jgi:hypothetical protein